MKARAIASRALVGIALLAAVGCKYSSSSNEAGALSGAYLGLLTSYVAPQPPSAPVTVFGAVDKDGMGYFLPVSTASTDIMAFQGLTGFGNLTSPEYDVPTEGQPVPRGAQNWKFTATASNSTTNELKGGFMGVDAGTNVDLKSQPTFVAHSGTYHGPDMNRLTSVTATLDANGTLSGSDGLGCHISGKLIEEGNLDVYDVSLNITGSASCHGALSGVGFVEITDVAGQFSGAPGPYLYLLGANGDFSHGFAMALKLE